MTEAPSPRQVNLAPTTPETERMTDVAFLLDVDGVVTDPEKKQVVEPQIFDRIIENLTTGNPVALNTGRSTNG